MTGGLSCAVHASPAVSLNVKYMSSAKHMIALLRSHLEGDDVEFLSVAMQAAAHEARLGHTNVAEQLKDLVDESKRRRSATHNKPGQLVVLEPRGDLANLLSVHLPATRLGDMALSDGLSERLHRILTEQRHPKTTCSNDIIDTHDIVVR